MPSLLDCFSQFSLSAAAIAGAPQKMTPTSLLLLTSATRLNSSPHLGRPALRVMYGSPVVSSTVERREVMRPARESGGAEGSGSMSLSLHPVR